MLTTKYFDKTQIDTLLYNYYMKNQSYIKTDTSILYSKIIDHGGDGAVLFEWVGEPISPKNHLSRIFGEPPLVVSKYWESGDSNKDGNAGVRINLCQDKPIQYATPLSNLITPSISGS